VAKLRRSGRKNQRLPILLSCYGSEICAG